ncbi:MAG: PilZ domain-containing protein [Bradyrhizobium sp.]|uniref:PilZ domain-containing protein n=1 Tax=Bradyrhizobium sp. TaxID=376 RepID=UPI0012086445|nr:PilZ domain-containing protein [Bradyrhizobium sp.]THD48458.1 MAG: PilZ domain-containing protein [Bradyrhizobium sp.]
MSTERFLKQRAVNIAVNGHYTLPNWYDPQGKLRTFACRTTRVSPYRMMVDVPVVGKVGDSLTSYFRDFGKLDGHISDTRPGGFLLELDVSYATRERLSNKLTWLEEKQKDPAIIDLRRHPRVVPAQSHSTLTLADGAIHTCFIIDMSATGAAVSAELQPEIGTPLAVGTCVGRVTRIFAGGFAVKFVEKLNQNDLDRFIARPITGSASGAAKAVSEPDESLVEKMDA